MNVLEYGIARLAVIPIRKHPDHRSEQVTQLLFGEHYELISYSDDRQWGYLRICADHYEGWIDIQQHSCISQEYFHHINYINYRITTELTSTILYKKHLLTIFMGSVIPISDPELFEMKEQFAFSGESRNLGQKSDPDFLKEIACRYINTPYLWGGRTPLGIDCSGFVQMVFKICGYPLPRDACQQLNIGNPLEKIHTVRLGDLAFFSEKDATISHVGILLDQHRIIHASGRVKIDQWTEQGIISRETNRQTHILVQVNRILDNPL